MVLNLLANALRPRVIRSYLSLIRRADVLPLQSIVEKAFRQAEAIHFDQLISQEANENISEIS